MSLLFLSNHLGFNFLWVWLRNSEGRRAETSWVFILGDFLRQGLMQARWGSSWRKRYVNHKTSWDCNYITNKDGRSSKNPPFSYPLTSPEVGHKSSRDAGLHYCHDLEMSLSPQNKSVVIEQNLALLFLLSNDSGCMAALQALEIHTIQL